MKRELIIVGVVVGVVIVIAVVYAVIRGVSSGTPGTQTGTTGTLPPVASSTTAPPSTSTASFPTGDTFQIGTSQGEVTVNNFYKTDAYVTQDNETVALVENDNYTIDYDRDDSGFIIALLSVPGSLQDARTAAEIYFLSQLGVSQSDACKLNVDERVLDKTSSYDGDLMGLSFCGASGAYQGQ